MPHPIALIFFEREFATWSQDFLDRAISPVLNKLEAFLANDLIRNILGQPQSTLHIEQALAKDRIVIVNLSWVASYSSAPRQPRSSATLPPLPHSTCSSKRPQISSGVISSMYGQIRKFKISHFLLTQAFSDLDEKTRAAIAANGYHHLLSPVSGRRRRHGTSFQP
jgi:hypothetical protein